MVSADKVIEKAARAFAGVRGVESVVLGGSRATGCAGAHSDIDIGIYYDAREFDADELRRRASALDDAHRTDAATEPGAWGPWINGGGWLTVDGCPVDILYRDIARVSAVIDDCLRGNITIDYQCGHPFGFVNSIYMGEAACCVELFSASSRLREEKARLSPFPEVYRAAAIDKFNFGEAKILPVCTKHGFIRLHTQKRLPPARFERRAGKFLSVLVEGDRRKRACTIAHGEESFTIFNALFAYLFSVQK